MCHYIKGYNGCQNPCNGYNTPHTNPFTDEIRCNAKPIATDIMGIFIYLKPMDSK
jgi:hypothetical protein